MHLHGGEMDPEERNPTPPPLPPPSPPGASSGPPPPPRLSQAWYSGPFPPPDSRGGFGKSLLRSASQGCMVALGFGLGLMAVSFLGIALIAGFVIAVADNGGGGGARDSLDTEFVEGDEDSRDKLLSIRISGVILGEEAEAPASIFVSQDFAFGYEIKETLILAARDRSIRGVVIELQTPGGTIYGSRAIADGIREYQRISGRPVLAFISGISASGGVYAMVPADRILADWGSIIGSIGVRLGGAFPYWDGVIATEGGLLGGGVTTENGIKYTSITAGRSKDIGSPVRPMTDEERTVLTRGVENAYDDFVAHVAEHRGITDQDIRNRLGALIYDNETAQQLGLIDGTADRQTAYAELAKLANISNWQVVREKGGGNALAGLFSQAGTAAQASADDLAHGLCFPATAILVYYGDPQALCR